jgi:hypothetical protein
MPIKQPGETGPKPIIAKMPNTQRALICAEFILMFLEKFYQFTGVDAKQQQL